MANRNGGLRSDVCQSATVPLELAAVSPAAPTAPPSSVERGGAQPQGPVESATCPVAAVRRAAAAGTCLADGGASCVGPAHGACATALMEDLWPRVAAPDARPFLEAPTTPSSPPAWLAWLTARADAAKPRVPSEANLVLATLTGGAAAVGLFLWSWPTGFSIPADAKERDGAARTLVFVAGANLLAALASGLEAVGAVALDCGAPPSSAAAQSAVPAFPGDDLLGAVDFPEACEQLRARCGMEFVAAVDGPGRNLFRTLIIAAPLVLFLATCLEYLLACRHFAEDGPGYGGRAAVELSSSRGGRERAHTVMLRGEYDLLQRSLQSRAAAVQYVDGNALLLLRRGLLQLLLLPLLLLLLVLLLLLLLRLPRSVPQLLHY